MLMRNSLAGIALLSGVLAVATASAAQAQDDNGDRRGFSGSVGFGVSSAGISCKPQCATDRQSGPAWTFRAGAHVASQLVIGLDATLFRADIKSQTPVGKWTMTWLTLSGIWYPNSDEDFFLKLGVGVAAIRVDVPFPKSGVIGLNSSDFGAVVGVGKDFRFTDMLAVTAFGNVLFTPSSAALSNGSSSGAKVSADMIHVGLAVTIP
jgi:hypothetical protein